MLPGGGRELSKGLPAAPTEGLLLVQKRVEYIDPLTKTFHEQKTLILTHDSWLFFLKTNVLVSFQGLPL